MSRKPLPLLYALGFCLSVLAAKSVDAQQVEVRADLNRAPAQTSGQAHHAKHLLGSKVYIEGNVSVGTVDDIVFDDSGYLEYLIVANEGKLVTIPWEAAKFNFQERSAQVNITADRFREVPTYSQDKYPVFSAPAYRTEIYKYYGITPRERRLERRLDRRN